FFAMYAIITLLFFAKIKTITLHLLKNVTMEERTWSMKQIARLARAGHADDHTVGGEVGGLVDDIALGGTVALGVLDRAEKEVTRRDIDCGAVHGMEC
ncbi:MAG: hypothetical protein AAF548_20835, partial [Actinomycetota bacterium]